MISEKSMGIVDRFDTSRGVGRLWTTIPDGGRLRRTLFSVATVSLAIASLLVISPLTAQVPEKPLEIGVLALGPRKIPAWRCGQEDIKLAADEPRMETKPFYVMGLLDELEKLNYVENRPENAGKPGRRFVLNLRMGTLPEVRAYAREFVDKRVDIIVAVATSGVRAAQ